MEACNSSEIEREIPGIVTLYKNGTIERSEQRDDVPPKPNYSKDIEFEAGDGNLLKARIFKPAPEEKSDEELKLPLILFFCGGGFVSSSYANRNVQEFCEDMASSIPAMVICAGYRLAPEHRLPAAYEDGFCALRWIRTESFKDPWIASGADLRRVFVAGVSSGANIAHHVVAMDVGHVAPNDMPQAVLKEWAHVASNGGIHMSGNVDINMEEATGHGVTMNGRPYANTNGHPHMDPHDLQQIWANDGPFGSSNTNMTSRQHMEAKGLLHAKEVEHIFTKDDGESVMAKMHLVANHGGPVNNKEQMVGVPRLVLIVPFLGGEAKTNSEFVMEKVSTLPLKACENCWALSLPVGANRDHPYSSVDISTNPSHIVAWPPTLVVVGDRDILIDRQVAYAKHLNSLNVDVSLKVLHDADHFMSGHFRHALFSHMASFMSS